MVHASYGDYGPSDSGREVKEAGPKGVTNEESGAEGCAAQDEDGPLHESVLWGVADVLREDSGGGVPAGEKGASTLMSQMRQQQRQSGGTGGGGAQTRAPLLSHSHQPASGNGTNTSTHAPKFVDIPTPSNPPLNSSSNSNLPNSSSLWSNVDSNRAPKFLGDHGSSSQAGRVTRSSRQSSASASRRGRARPPQKASMPARAPLPLPALAGVASSKAAMALDPAQWTATVASSKAAAALAPPKQHARAPLSPEEAAAEAAAAAARAAAGLPLASAFSS